MPTTRGHVLRLLMGAAAIFGTAHGVAADDAKLSISAPWTMATPETAQVAGGFLTLTNTGQAVDRLIRVETEVSQSVEIHEMQVVNGVMMMRQHGAGITIKPGAQVVLKPFSHHLMFMDIKHPLKAGETVKGTLIFEKSGPIEVAFSVEPMGSNGPKTIPSDKAVASPVPK